jgi:hypothetical protein
MEEGYYRDWLRLCAGGCGKVLKRGMNSLQDPICRRCRRRGALLVCEHCNRPFRARNGSLAQRYCSVKHAALGRWLGRKLDNLPEL